MRLAVTGLDGIDGVLATGTRSMTTLLVSRATRHPDGADAEYLRWHTLDHRPEQHRLSAVRASLRLVSTPECRAARLQGDERVDALDHVMTYFFTDEAGLQPFNELSTALGDAGRKPRLLPPVQRGVYSVSRREASPRAKVGADVLPWWPSVGVYLLLESATAPASELTEVDGVVGTWAAESRGVDKSLASAQPGQLLTYCFLDGNPIDVAERLRPLLTERWSSPDIRPLLAAPFQIVVPHQWDRHVR